MHTCRQKPRGGVSTGRGQHCRVQSLVHTHKDCICENKNRYVDKWQAGLLPVLSRCPSQEVRRQRPVQLAR